MQTLVTGGAGFIGSAISRALLERGHGVRILDNLSSGSMDNVPDDASFVEGDIRDFEAVSRCCREVDTVFHEAAFKSVPLSIEDPLTAEASNAGGTLNVLLAASEQGVKRVIYASSSSAYGDADGVKVEDMATNPVSPYGVSKLAGEHYCRVWHRVKSQSTVALRYFNVFGPGQPSTSRYAAVFPAFISALQSGQPAQIYGDGEQTRDFTFIDDVVEANLLAMGASDQVSGEVINICAGSPKSVNEVYRTISELMGVRIDPVHLPRRSGDIMHSHGDISKATRLLDWSPTTPWHDAVTSTIRWFQSSATASGP